MDILGLEHDNKRQDNYVDFIVILKYLNQRCFSGTDIYTADRMEKIILEFLPRRTLEKRHLKGAPEDESLIFR